MEIYTICAETVYPLGTQPRALSMTALREYALTVERISVRNIYEISLLKFFVRLKFRYIN